MEFNAYHCDQPRWQRRKRTRIRATSMQEPVLSTNPTLPQELITEILLRLPVKPLLRFRSVSKSWLALISSPKFAKAHVSLCASNKDCTHHRLLLKFRKQEICLLRHCSVRSMFTEYDMELCYLTYSVKRRKNYVQVVGSVNGLICLTNGAKRFVILNPSTKAHKMLPDFGTLDDNPTYGFGYDERNDDYKVMLVYYCIVKIYSLKRDSWRSVCYPYQGVKFPGSGKLVNGNLHWTYNVDEGLDKGWNIVSFHLADEKWEKVEQPCYEQEDGVLVLGVLGNNLSVLCNGHHLRTDLDVWVMEEYGVKESWTKMFTFKYPHSPATLLDNPLFLLSIKGEISVMSGRDVYLCNPKDDSIIYGEIPDSGFVGEIFLESLVSPLLQNEGHNRNEGCQSSDGRN